MGGLRPRYLTLAAADLAGAVTIAALLRPEVQFAYRAPSLHVMIETTAAMAALIAAYLVYGRFSHSRSTSDLLLLAALAFLSVTKFVVPIASGHLVQNSERFAAWAALTASVLGSALFAASALVPARPLRRPVVSAQVLFGALFAVAFVLAIILADISNRLPLGLDPSTADARFPHFAASPALILMEVAGMLFFGLAAIGFTRRAEWTGDEFTTWLAASAALACFARLNYLFFPSLYAEWLYPADVMRLGAYLLILTGAAREISRYRRGLSTAAILDERRRIARDLHDGLAQELAFIVTKSRSLAEETIEPNVRELGRLAAAAERALDESRRAITALFAPIDESLEAAVVQTVEEVASRVGTRAEIEIDPNIQLPSASKEALLRVVREAVSNASRHGGASSVRVQLLNGDAVRLIVSDDGSGFDPTILGRDSGGYGLATMTERVHALGGELSIASRPKAGTKIEVVLP
ncbi:MAG: sensor histidine kinase [Actinobacteria bacterium]|nr:MAG: sensor histidine kinase [Actinomycetota bacterium]